MDSHTGEPDSALLPSLSHSDDVCWRFEAAWRSGTRPRIEDFLAPQTLSDHAAPEHELLVELVMLDLEYRWRTAADAQSCEEGDPIPVRPRLEDYVVRFPAFGPAADLPDELIGDEYRIRSMPAWGDHPTHAEYAARFPGRGSELSSALSAVDQEVAEVGKKAERQQQLLDAARGLTGGTPDVPAGLFAQPESTARGADGDTPGRRAVLFHCPHCRQAVELTDDRAFVEQSCPACGGRFEVVGDDALAYETRGGTLRRRTVFGRFELLESLGAGGQGAVWKAHDKLLDRVVALKIPRRGQLTPEEMERVFREARAAAQSRHPSIVRVHEVGIQDDTLFIVSDFVDGISLHDWLSGHRFTHQEACQICVQLAEAVHHAHEQGVIHRDLKPGNILLDRGGRPHLTDFGLAKREAGEETMTMDGAILGTPAYMAPEQARGEGHYVDRRADVYSLGVILFQLLTGELPFRGTYRMVLKQVIEDEPPSPRKFDGKVPQDLATVCLKCLEKTPAKRYATAQALADDLQRHLRGEPILAQPIGRVEKSWRWCCRNPAIAGWSLALLATLAFCFVVSGYLVLRMDRRAVAGNAPEPAASTLKADSAKKAANEADFPKVPPALSVVTNSIGMTFISIPAGEFEMGARDGEVGAMDDEKPRHRVRVDAFLVGQHEVTQAQFEKVLGFNPSWFPAKGGGSSSVEGMDTRRLPVENVTWYDAIACCNKLSEMESRKPHYGMTNVERSGDSITKAEVTTIGGEGYRLLTEAEWEYMARAGTRTIFPWGDSLQSDQANFDGHFPYGTAAKGEFLGRTAPVGSYPANPWGLHDVAGNVFEWVWDGYDIGYYGQFAGKVAENPLGHEQATDRVLRGGSWSDYARDCRPADRNGYDPGIRSGSGGFRLALAWSERGRGGGAKAAAGPGAEADGWKGRSPTRRAAADGAAGVTNSIGMTFISIPAGEFEMGARDGEAGAMDDEKPRHRVRVDAFLVGQHEVTQAQFESVLGFNPSHFSAKGGGSRSVADVDTSRSPVENVTWYDAIACCNKLSEMESRRPHYGMTNVARSGDLIARAEVTIIGGDGYRLLTEAEWEYVARAGTRTVFPWGDSLQSDQANFDGRFPYGTAAKGKCLGRTAPVGSYPASPWELHDVAGNVFEWVWDRYDGGYYGQFAGKVAENPLGPEQASARVLRGGSWSSTGRSCRPAYRIWDDPGYRYRFYGFRVALGRSERGRGGGAKAVATVAEITSRNVVNGKASGVVFGQDANQMKSGLPENDPRLRPGEVGKLFRPPLLAEPGAEADGWKGRSTTHRAAADGAAGVTNSIGMTFISIPAGEFEMGARDGEARAMDDDENPRHRVRINAFLVGQHEVTQAQFERVLGFNPSHFSAKGRGSRSVAGVDTSRLPVENVTWYDAIACCNKLSEMESRKPHYGMTNVERSGDSITKAEVTTIGGDGYRLLTEGEWEYMARAGTRTIFPWGDSLSFEEANFDGLFPYGTAAKGKCLGRTAPVGSYPANPWGLHDVAGNVFEWVWDGYDISYYGQFAGKVAENPLGPEQATFRVLRGGGWCDAGRLCRPANRGGLDPGSRYGVCGFRLALAWSERAQGAEPKR